MRRATLSILFLVSAAFLSCLMPHCAFAGQSDSVDIRVTVLDSPPQGTIVINKGDEYTNSTSVTLALYAWDAESNVDQMRFSNDNTNWSTPESYAITKTWNLTSGDGEKAVYVKFSDKAGIWSSAYSDTIILDTTPPQIVITSPQDNAIVNTPTLTVNYTSDGIAKTKQVTLQEGLNTITIQETDAAGNTGNAQIHVELDTVAPVIVITSPQNDTVFDNPNITVEYTLDGTAKSKNVTLAQGANTVTITEQDLAGNVGSAQVVVHYNPGTPVEPDTGGSITSPDGQASVEIPPAAIDTTVLISVTNLNPNNYDAAAPQDYDAQGVTAFGPDGQTFNIPVTIKIPLDKSQIPGTEIDLGILNKIQGSFDLTGQKMIVNSDSRSASAKVTHFSTYGALKNLISTGAAIGGGAEIPLPDLFTGAFSHQVKIVTPSGRKGIEPNISLLYRSNLRNGWLGYGWDLNPGAIERDIKAGPPAYRDAEEVLDIGDGSDGELNVTSETTTIDGTKNYTQVYIAPGATVTCSPWDGSTGGEIIIKCQGEVKVEGAIDVSGKGYRGGAGNINATSGEGPGGGGPGATGYETPGGGGGGGGYGTSGASGGGRGGSDGGIYGDSELTILYMGSGGGGGGGNNEANWGSGGWGGSGGGIVKIVADTITVNGTISSNGENGHNGTRNSGGGGGGGSGGSIYLIANSIASSGSIVTNGGGGGPASGGPGNGGSGGQGRIHVVEAERKDFFLYSSTGSRMDLANLVQNLYQSKIESGFVKFYKEADDSWKAVQKDGTKLYFGTSADSRLTNPKGTYRWLLDKIEDTNGNYMLLTYTQDSGQTYLSRISYTGNSVTGDLPTHTVDFILEDRTDNVTSLSGGALVTTRKRLKQVDVKVGGDLARRYVFNYTYSPDTNRSLLSSIDQYGSDSMTKFPTMTFKYRGK